LDFTSQVKGQAVIIITRHSSALFQPIGYLFIVVDTGEMCADLLF